jgi:mannose-6-phosphate isomerase
MLRLDEPLRFEPFLQPRVWGGDRLPRLLGSPSSPEPIGEAWTTSDHSVHRSVVADGAHKGESLRSLMKQQSDELVGSRTDSRFPWLVKFLDCNELLSVQVHPDKQAVARLVPGEGSKTEAWFILDVEPGARVWAGLKAGVDEAKLRAALANGTVAECLHTFAPKPGDCVFLPAGTVHAVGGGVLMSEIQETSDVTFRLYDWDRVDAQGRGRQLHLEEAIASIHWDAGPVTPIAARDVLRAADRGELVRCDAFVLEFRWVTQPTELTGGRMQTLIVVGGDGTWSDGRPLSVGESWVLPAAMATRTLTPGPSGVLAFLLARLP